jgi:MFS family permease
MIITDSLLKQKNFGLLWTGKFVSQLGDKMYSIAMAWWILNVSGSPGIMGLYMFAVTLPGILTGMISGVIIDRIDKKKILVLMDFIRGLLIGLLAMLFITGRVIVWHVFLVSMAVSIASSFFNPAVMTIIPVLTGKKSLHKANSFMQMIDGIATISGPLLGAAAVSIIGFQGAILINAVSYLVSAFFELFITISPDKKEISARVSSFFSEFKEGYKFIINRKTLLPVMIYISLGHFFIGAVMVMMPVIAEIPAVGNMFFWE